jgi:pre-rRNA-processing protein TSR1
MEGGHSHRAGSRRQTNKKHKNSNPGSRARKGQGGRTEKTRQRKSVKSLTNNQTLLGSRDARMLKVKQLTKIKKTEALARRRASGAAGSGARGAAPRFILVVGLAETADVDLVRDAMLATSTGSSVYVSPRGALSGVTTQLREGKNKRRVTVASVDYRDTLAVCDLAKVADVVVFVMSCAEFGVAFSQSDAASVVTAAVSFAPNPLEGCVDEEGENMISALRAQGLPATVCVSHGLSTMPGGSTKRRTECRRLMQRFFRSEFGDAVKIVMDSPTALVAADRARKTGGVAAAAAASTKALGAMLSRVVLDLRPTELSWREKRSYMLLDDAAVVAPAAGASADAPVEVHIRGYVRSCALDPNALLHVTGIGSFQQLRVVAAADPSPMDRRDVVANVGETLSTPDPAAQQALITEAVADVLEGEQTWPTMDEMGGAAPSAAEYVSVADLARGGAAAGGAGGSDALSDALSATDAMSDGGASDGEAEGDFEWPVPEGEQGIGQPPDALVRAMALARGQATDSEDEAESADEDGELVIADDAEMEALARPAKKRSLLEQREEEEKEFAEYPDEGECSFMYRYIPRESCSQFDSLPLTYLTKSTSTSAGSRRASASPSTAASSLSARRRGTRKKICRATTRASSRLSLSRGRRRTCWRASRRATRAARASISRRRPLRRGRRRRGWRRTAAARAARRRRRRRPRRSSSRRASTLKWCLRAATWGWRRRSWR